MQYESALGPFFSCQVLKEKLDYVLKKPSNVQKNLCLKPACLKFLEISSNSSLTSSPMTFKLGIPSESCLKIQSLMETRSNSSKPFGPLPQAKLRRSKGRITVFRNESKNEALGPVSLHWFADFSGGKVMRYSLNNY